MKTMKTLLVFASLLVARNSFAASLQDLQVKDLDKVYMSEYSDFNDSTLMKVKYVGTAASALMFISSGMLSIDAPSGTALVSSVSLNASAYDTLGELCDYLDSQSLVTCSLTGGKRNDNSVILLNDASSVGAGLDINVPAGYSVAIGTGSINAAESIAYINRIGITPQSGRRVILKYCNVQTDGVGSIELSGKLRKFESVSDGVTRDDSVVISSAATANDTSEVDGNIYGGYWVEFAKDAHVVISAGNAIIQQTNTSFLECFWDEK